LHTIPENTGEFSNFLSRNIPTFELFPNKWSIFPICSERLENIYEWRGIYTHSESVAENAEKDKYITMVQVKPAKL
jgi:hypothetical protein